MQVAQALRKGGMACMRLLFSQRLCSANDICAALGEGFKPGPLEPVSTSSALVTPSLSVYPPSPLLSSLFLHFSLFLYFYNQALSNHSNKHMSSCSTCTLSPHFSEGYPIYAYNHLTHLFIIFPDSAYLHLSVHWYMYVCIYIYIYIYIQYTYIHTYIHTHLSRRWSSHVSMMTMLTSVTYQAPQSGICSSSSRSA